MIAIRRKIHRQQITFLPGSFVSRVEACLDGEDVLLYERDKDTRYAFNETTGLIDRCLPKLGIRSRRGRNQRRNGRQARSGC